MASKATAAAAKKASRTRTQEDLTPGDLVASKATAAAAKQMSRTRIREDLTPGDVMASKATAAAAKQASRARVWEEMIHEEREADLGLYAYNKRIRYCNVSSDAIPQAAATT